MTFKAAPPAQFARRTIPDLHYFALRHREPLRHVPIRIRNKQRRCLPTAARRSISRW
ncbi:MAG: hypothetical protein ACLPVW_15345 [Terriglobales bacterium]